LVSAASSILDLYTFSEEQPGLDLFSLTGSVVAQEGSSGGAVINRVDGKLIGVIVTTTTGETTEERELNAITMSHISRSLQKNTGKDLISFLAGDLEITSQNFYETEFTRLKDLLVKQLDKQ